MSKITRYSAKADYSVALRDWDWEGAEAAVAKQFDEWWAQYPDARVLTIQIDPRDARGASHAYPPIVSMSVFHA